MESQDQTQILNAIVDTIRACAQSDINVSKLTAFDIEYLFTKIRSKSVGEKATVAIKCSECENSNKVDVNLDKIDKTNKIKLNDHYTIQMKYPTYLDILNTNIKTETTADQLYATIIMSLDKLFTKDEIIEMADESWEEKEQFIDSLTTEQFNSIVQYMTNAPSLKHNIEFKCESCGADNEVTLNGLRDFF